MHIPDGNQEAWQKALSNVQIIAYVAPGGSAALQFSQFGVIRQRDFCPTLGPQL